MSQDKDTSNEDLNLFRSEMADVKPIKSDKVNLQQAKKRAPRQNISPKSSQDFRLSTDHAPECGVHLSFNRPGVNKAQLKNLRTGKMPAEASLDLHGCTAEDARIALLEFMNECEQQQYKLVIIVHGKGFGSADKKAVIKPLVNKWLRELENVLAFHSAQPRDGGTGSVYVLLKSI